jgi:hypothetical protein
VHQQYHDAYYCLQIGFISYGEWAQHGVRYLILPARSPYRIGAWSPLSTSDQGSPWGGSNIWVRGQGAFVAKAIWFHEHFNNPIEVSWSGMSDSEKEDLAAWLEERAELRQKEKILQKKEHEELKALHGDELHEVQAKMAMDRYYESQLACRAECGEENPKFTCSKCRIVRYCSAACQTEDWKVSLTYLLSLVSNLIWPNPCTYPQYHKTFCGKT